MSRSVSRVVAALRRLVASTDADDTDRALLGRFAQDRDQQAFAEVVARHGPLVRGVCRRLLHDRAAAEDVFQATFLVLAKKAGSRWHASVGPWLYAVAVRLCRKASARRPAASVDPDTLLRIPAPAEAPDARLEQEETRGVLEEELARLPEGLRGPLVLCYLQGLTRDEAARQLGVSLAMLKRRLERGRRLLSDRLTRRGVSLAATLGVGLGAAPLAAGVAAQTAEAAVAFLQGGGASAPVALLLRDATVPAAGRWLVASV